jgi:hypothetical protein
MFTLFCGRLQATAHKVSYISGNVSMSEPLYRSPELSWQWQTAMNLPYFLTCYLFLAEVILLCGFPPIIFTFLNSLFIFMHFSSLAPQLNSFKLFWELSRVAAYLALWGSPFQFSTFPPSKGILSKVFSCESSNKALRPKFLFHA